MTTAMQSTAGAGTGECKPAPAAVKASARWQDGNTHQALIQGAGASWYWWRSKLGHHGDKNLHQAKKTAVAVSRRQRLPAVATTEKGGHLN
jgi:hypothetical protein